MNKDTIRFSGKVPVKGKHFEETEDTFTIFDVPILAEMVQYYPGKGNAYKKADEILKVEVNNIPLTIVDNSPTHPDHLAGLNTLGKRDVVVGYMSEPSKTESKKSDTKRYADFVLYNTPKIDALKREYLAGNFIDTSIGFMSEDDETPGEFLGMKYDFIQTNIVLDHNAILIDRNGNFGIGRMPSPIGGIGADSIDINHGGKIKMSEELQKQVDSLTKVNEELKKELDSFKKSNNDEVQKSLDEAVKAKDELAVELKDMKDELQTVKDELKVFKDKEAEILNSKRDELKKHYPETAELFDKADASYINKKFDEIQEKKEKAKDIGTDMFGPNGVKSASVEEQTRYEKVYGKKQ